jgi:hypothetical protein
MILSVFTLLVDNSVHQRKDVCLRIDRIAHLLHQADGNWLAVLPYNGHKTPFPLMLDILLEVGFFALVTVLSIHHPPVVGRKCVRGGPKFSYSRIAVDSKRKQI